ncbi:unnamed protein product [Anisakis simplex]|uniref:SRCR domain-containing protein n=1 Tax=Anisakis simplex TaxID=6269 RepID=A0A3P6T3A5_ANISI|nr:unnamed protein product [Anisakis simplex]
MNAYHWLTPRWEYNPLVNILKTYVEPRECFGTEKSLDRCTLRMNGNISMWQCMDNEHFNFIYCGSAKILDSEYLGNWGGITFSQSSLEYQQSKAPDKLILSRLNITHNRGRGLTVWVTNLQGAGTNTGMLIELSNVYASTSGKITLPYNVRGMLNICAPKKQFTVNNRIILFYKYDSYPIDCVKSFSAPSKNIAFRFLLVSCFLESLQVLWSFILFHH